MARNKIQELNRRNNAQQSNNSKPTTSASPTASSRDIKFGEKNSEHNDATNAAKNAAKWTRKQCRFINFGSSQRWFLFLLLVVLLRIITVYPRIIRTASAGHAYDEEQSFYVNHNPTTTTTTPSIDFVTAGIMKSGTSTLLFAFADHPEVQHADYEMCAVTAPSIVGSWGLRRNFDQLKRDAAETLYKKKQKKASLATASNNNNNTTTTNSTQIITQQQQQVNHNLKLGLKCPLIAFNPSTIERVNAHSPHTKFLVTLRHPILTVESLYNYHVVVAYKHLDRRVIPSFQALTKFDPFLSYGAFSFRGLLSIARYEDHLINFKKTVLRRPQRDMDFLRATAEINSKNTTATTTTDPPDVQRVYLIAMDQMSDPNETRNEIFRRDLQSYLGLQEPLRSMTKPENKNVWKTKYKESIDICNDDKNPHLKQVRQHLLDHANATAEWIQQYFMTDPGVRISNREHFVEIMQNWSIDPCEERRQKKNKKTTPK